MAWTSRQIYDVTRIMIYALVGIFLICALVAAVPERVGMSYTKWRQSSPNW